MEREGGGGDPDTSHHCPNGDSQQPPRPLPPSIVSLFLRNHRRKRGRFGAIVASISSTTVQTRQGAVVAPDFGHQHRNRGRWRCHELMVISPERWWLGSEPPSLGNHGSTPLKSKGETRVKPQFPSGGSANPGYHRIGKVAARPLTLSATSITVIVVEIEGHHLPLHFQLKLKPSTFLFATFIF
ncbi:hypothetical protein CRG98_041535 [Punica granatum]|uniref:Uncharacterized protein n=1 Tax=Punica granatum TaxID=22663 RepID=A0A2I0I3P5_PUNGR|nr:hypothetical protein CRG98_041535 [Punica granatum]